MKRLREIYGGFLWPYLTFIAAFAGGGAWITHSRWHDWAYPLLVVAIIGMSAAHSKIRDKR